PATAVSPAHVDVTTASSIELSPSLSSATRTVSTHVAPGSTTRPGSRTNSAYAIVAGPPITSRIGCERRGACTTSTRPRPSTPSTNGPAIPLASAPTLPFGLTNTPSNSVQRAVARSPPAAGSNASSTVARAARSTAARSMSIRVVSLYVYTAGFTAGTAYASAPSTARTPPRDAQDASANGTALASSSRRQRFIVVLPSPERIRPMRHGGAPGGPGSHHRVSRGRPQGRTELRPPLCPAPPLELRAWAGAPPPPLPSAREAAPLPPPPGWGNCG